MNSPAAGVHHPSEPHNPGQPVRPEMLAYEHSAADLVKQLEITLPTGSERIPPKVWEHAIHDHGEASHLPLERVIAAVRPERPAPEVSRYFFENLGAVTVLADRQARPRLPANAQRSAWREGDRKASLTVDVSRQIRRKVGLMSI